MGASSSRMPDIFKHMCCHFTHSYDPFHTSNRHGCRTERSTECDAGLSAATSSYGHGAISSNAEIPQSRR